MPASHHARRAVLWSTSLTMLALSAVSPLRAAADTWSPTGTMAVARSRHTATLLPDGRVLVAGGITGDLTSPATTATAEIYDPATGLWSATASMATPRSRHTAVLLADGRVLVAGGRNNGLATATVELFDVTTGTWSATGSLAVSRDSHTATLMSDGSVLVAGGLSGGERPGNPVEKTAEVYHPGTGNWSLVDHMSDARYGHTATLLTDDTVLVAGGTGPRGDGVFRVRAELYHPGSGVWRNVDSMATPRGFHTATLLADGSVLVAGGFTLPANDRNVTAAAELFEPGSQRWTSTGPLAVARNAGPYGATLLLDGRVLVCGGRTNTAELYDVTTGTWTLTGSMAVSRSSHTVTLLPDGTVLVTGGERFGEFIATAEVYAP